MAAEKLIIDHLDLWTAAIKRKSLAGRGSSSKIELYGIKKLRELILELAVRGLLVPQDPSDEPASELLKRIVVEKTKLVKEGKIKKERPLPPVGEDETLFSLPSGWAWCRLEHVSLHSAAGWSPKCEEIPRAGSGWGVLKVSAVTWGVFNPAENKALPSNLEPVPDYEVKPGDFLISRANTAELVARSVVVQDDAPPKLMMSDKIIRLKFSREVYAPYLSLFNNSSGARRYYLQVAGGTSSSMKNVSRLQIQSLAVSLPPLPEQHRIVVKVDELMALCDQLEHQTDTSLSAHQTLVETLLNTLTSAADHTQFTRAWQRIAAHFDTLFTTEESIDKLKQTILQLAVMGKLVPQDPNDESASELLKKIAAEKAKLVKEGKIKNEASLSKIEDQEKPFELPSKWEWSRLIEISANIHYGYTASSDESLRSVRLLRITDIQDDVVNWDSVPGCEIEADKIAQYKLIDDDILIARTGGTIGKSYLVQGISLCAIFASYLIRVRHLNGISARYKKIYLGSQLYWRQLYAKSMGTGQPNVNGESLKGLIVPIPPLAEQLRIAVKVDELMAICNRLRTHLVGAQLTQVSIVDAIQIDGKNP